MQVYHYKNNRKAGDWVPFGLNEKDGKLWNLFCQELGLKNPKDPNPYYKDYLAFINQIHPVDLAKSKPDIVYIDECTEIDTEVLKSIKINEWKSFNDFKRQQLTSAYYPSKNWRDLSDNEVISLINRENAHICNNEWHLSDLSNYGECRSCHKRI